MMWRFTPELDGTAFPISMDMVESLKRDGYDSPWYGHPVYVNKYRNGMGFEGQGSFFEEVMAEAEVGKKELQSKTTHPEHLAHGNWMTTNVPHDMMSKLLEDGPKT